ncbi:MAG: beta-1,4-N-acetylglucosaminyltransferase [Phenylobacterium sp.]
MAVDTPFMSVKRPDKPQVLLLIYGAGGHKTEMKRLLAYLHSASSSSPNSETIPNHLPDFVSLGAGPLPGGLAHFEADDLRSKTSRLHSVLFFLPTLVKILCHTLILSRRYKVLGVLSTGPSLCIIPMVLFRLAGVKTVFLETFCRFQTRSVTGRIMANIAHRFLIQNIQLQSLYPKAEYCGRL